MSNKRNYKRRPSKRQRRMKIIIYIMVIGMALSTLTYGLAFLL
ncbi:MAG TPA: stressosome-associated protein Prli42 [Bacillota bacterium]|nr:stressosome-associated protein Prli42 [Bacillota bacterium]